MGNGRGGGKGGRTRQPNLTPIARSDFRDILPGWENDGSVADVMRALPTAEGHNYDLRPTRGHGLEDRGSDGPQARAVALLRTPKDPGPKWKVVIVRRNAITGRVSYDTMRSFYSREEAKAYYVTVKE